MTDELERGQRSRAGELAGFLHVCRATEAGDVLRSTHRAHGHVLARELR